MGNIQYTGILCGNFSTNNNKNLTKKLQKSEWKHIKKDTATRNLGYRYYYSKFYDICYGDKASGIDGIERYEYQVNRDIMLNIKDGCYNLHIAKLTLYMCPFDIALFSIEVHIEANDHNDITFVMSVLRNITDYGSYKESLQPYIDIAIEPIMQLRRETSDSGNCSATECNSLLLYGNKLKLFQIVTLDPKEYADKGDDMHLYEFGTLSCVPKHDMLALNAPSVEYFNNIIENNRISVFNNWKVLALFDTFTIISGIESDAMHKNWVDNYFGMMYIYGLFVKVYLFDVNNNYDSHGSSRHSINESYDAFETKYYFLDISYNFLPRMINSKIHKTLEIETEKERIFERIKRQNIMRERQSDAKMNRLLFVMTCLTIFSAIWDAACLINEMFPFSEYLSAPILGFRFVSCVFVLLLIWLFILINNRKY